MRVLVLTVLVVIAAPASAQKRKKQAEPPRPAVQIAPAPEPAAPLRRPCIIEIEPAQITGAYNQTAVFLYDRKPLRERLDAVRGEVLASRPASRATP